MRSVLARVAAIVVISVLLVSAALGTLSDEGTSSWGSRTGKLIRTAVTFDYGNSVTAHAPVLAAIKDGAVRSVAIIGGTALVFLLVSVPLGVLSATHSHSVTVTGVRRMLDAASTLPVLVWSTLIFVLAARLTGATLLGVIPAAIVALCLGDRMLADLTQRVELSTRELMSEPYMRTVRAADLGYRRHLLLSLIRPVGTALVARSMFLISAAIVAEQVFEIRGLGYLVVKALGGRPPETTLILAACLALVAIGVLFRILHGVALASADPRTRGA